MRLCCGRHGVPMNFQFALKETGSADWVILRHSCRPRAVLFAYICTLCTLLVFWAGVPSFPEWNLNATTTAGVFANQQEIVRTRQSPERPEAQPSLESTDDWNRRLREPSVSADPKGSVVPREYTIAPADVLDFNVSDGRALSRDGRASATAETSRQLLHPIHPHH